jgi:hypothetical protein
VPCFAGEAAGDAAVFEETDGELDVRGVVCALASVQRAATTQTPLMRQLLVFIAWFLVESGIATDFG